jgi:hypothetical protein
MGLRLYFDECCSRPMLRELRQFFAADYPDLVTAHVLDSYEQGTWDSRWLKPLQDEQTWIVVTRDWASRRAKEKLPVICRELGITFITLSPIIIDGGYTVQKCAIVATWKQILKVPELPKGTHVRLGMSARGESFELCLKEDGIWRRF